MPRAIRSLAATGIVGVLLAGPAVAPAAAATPQPPAHDRTSAAEARRVDRVPTPKLDWYNCYDYAECATVRLPLDYDNPKGATTEIAVLRVKARDQKRKIGSLFVNPGGPGGSGTEHRARRAVLPQRRRCSTASTSSASTRAASAPATTSSASVRPRTRPRRRRA